MKIVEEWTSFKKWSLFIGLMAFVLPGNSQDVQFSQFYASPLYLNPALTGGHSGTYRIMTSYRNQWGGVAEHPFTSFVAGGDVAFTIRNKRGSFSGGNDRAAAGIQFFSDRISQFDYNTNHLSLFGAFHKLLSAKSNQYLSAGIQLGLGQRGINYEDITFQDQFNGVDQFTGPTAESLPANSLAYSDMAIGIHFSSQPAVDKGIYFGIAYHHFNQPNISFFSRDIRFTEEFLPENLAAKLTLHGGLSISQNEFLAIQPRAMYIAQGEAATAVIGSNFKYRLENTDGSSVHFGAWLRATDNISTFQPSDVILSAAFEKNGLLIGLSYDHQLRDLGATILGQGIFEFSISYIGEHENENQICPEF